MTKTGLAVLLLLAGTAGASAQSGEAAKGKDTYIAECVGCHASAARIVRKIGGGTPEDRADWLDDFLSDHHLTDMDAKADLMAYLLAI
ncbi:hypothetical protein [Oricola sp.]|uniref:hypothetical protein n=1 Tax=Oricola sp. TaxID=1979950 RepID=UPI0025F4F328|nr:hypothetical protein [Oricola sp.]MCI5077884.1 hypothetical protein [Oricola sp.]